MTSFFTYGLLCIAALLVTFGGHAASAQGGPNERPPPEVAVLTAHAQQIPIIRQLVGRLAATRVAQVRARVAGIILERTYTEGTDVKRGQVLFRIDPAPLQAALHAEQAALAKAQADATNAALIARRYSELVGKRLISNQDLDSALAAERTTAAAVKQAQANVEKARLDLGYATVTAPIAGRAGRALVTEGALVGQGEATELTTVEQIDPLYLNFSQSVTELELLRRMSKTRRSTTQVEVSLPDGSPYAYPGTLDFTDAAVDPGTGTVSLRAVLPNPEHRLLPGMFVQLRLTMGQREHAFRLPHAALSRDGKGAYVLVVDPAAKVVQRRVQVHDMTLAEWVVTGDLADGERVIVAGLQKAQPGAMVKVVPWTGDQQAKGRAPKDRSGAVTPADRS